MKNLLLGKKIPYKIKFCTVSLLKKYIIEKS